MIYSLRLVKSGHTLLCLVKSDPSLYQYTEYGYSILKSILYSLGHLNMLNIFHFLHMLAKIRCFFVFWAALDCVTAQIHLKTITPFLHIH